MKWEYDMVRTSRTSVSCVDFIADILVATNLHVVQAIASCHIYLSSAQDIQPAMIFSDIPNTLVPYR